MNTLKQNRCVPASMGQEREVFLGILSRLQEIGTLVALIDTLVTRNEEGSAEENNCLIRDWEALNNSVKWDNVPEVVLRYIALQTYNCKSGQKVFFQALSSKVVWLADFYVMAEDWKNVDFDMTWLVMQAAREAADYCKSPKEGQYLAMKLANGGAYSWMAMQRNTTE